MLKECILAATIAVSPGQQKQNVSIEPAYYELEKGNYKIDLEKLTSAPLDTFKSFIARFEFGSGDDSFINIILEAAPERAIDNLYYTLAGIEERVYLITSGEIQASNVEEYSTFYVDEKQQVELATDDDFKSFNLFIDNYVTVEETPSFSLKTIFEELAEGLKNLAIGFVNAFSGLGSIFYNDGLTYVSILLLGGLALTIGFWAIDKLLGLGKMGLGSLGKARAKKSKKGQ